MSDAEFDFIVAEAPDALPVTALRPAELAGFVANLPAAQAGWLRTAGFGARAGELLLLPGEAGVAGAVFGLGAEGGVSAFGGLARALPEEGSWRLVPGEYDAQAALLFYSLGAYAYRRFKPAERGPAKLAAPAGSERTLMLARASWMVRDLINTPANLLGPAELAEAAMALAAAHGAESRLVAGDALEASYPTISAVGAGAARGPAVAMFQWRGSAAGKDAPLVSLCGKGVCFDSGGLDLKPSTGMLRMKKDMGGAAIALGLARAVMEADLPVRLALRIGCVENSVSGAAMRPLDVVKTRRGITVEIGNTDAEGRLVLADLLAEASDEKPDLLVDFATLTGAARVALGPELPALFCNDEPWAAGLLAAGAAAHDPMWRLPLWPGYRSWINSPIAELNNVSTRPFAGAVVAALFLERFVASGVPWAHLDVYAWNDSQAPGRPEGGEAQTLRAIFAAIVERLASGWFRE